MHNGKIDWGTLAGLRFLTVLDQSSNALRGEREFLVHSSSNTVRLSSASDTSSFVRKDHARCSNARAEFAAPQGESTNDHRLVRSRDMW